MCIFVDMSVRTWIEAARLRTLPLAIANMAMGNGLAALHGIFSWPIALLSILTAVFLQIMSNFANDYGDSIHGADSVIREGPQRAVQSGTISSEVMKKAILLTGALAFICGIVLLLVAFESVQSILIFLLIGLVALWAAYNYTAGSKPYGYAGLGDLSVLIFFGLAAVMGCYYLQTKSLDPIILLPALSCGLLSVGVLNVNNIRDIKSDKEAGKRSIPVMIGRRSAIVYHHALIFTAIILLVIFTLKTLEYATVEKWLYLLAIPLFIYHLKKVRMTSSAMELDPFLKQLALSTAFMVILFLVGSFISVG